MLPQIEMKKQERQIQKNVPRVQMTIKNDSKDHLLLLLTFSCGRVSGHNSWLLLLDIDVDKYVD